MHAHTFQVKSWAIINGEKQFIWSITTYSDKPKLVKAKCDDGKFRTVDTLKFIK